MSQFSRACFAAVLVFLPSQVFAESINRSGKGDLAKINMARTYAPAQMWVGPYMGFSLGYGSGSAQQFYDRAGNHGFSNLSPAGLNASANLGYNWMYNSNIIYGVEGDVGSLGAAQGTTTVFDGHNWSNSFGGFASLRGRAGYAMDNVLFYGTAGLVLADINDVSIGNTPGETATAQGLRAGLAVGAGAEYAFNPQWSLKGEFLYMDFAKVSGLSANNEAFSFKDNLGVVRVGLDYRF
jgi:outer membrane immunogenic protein